MVKAKAVLEGLGLAKCCQELAMDRKALDPVILDLRGLNGPAEWFLICSGESEPQLKAIAQSIHKGLKEDHGMMPFGNDGKSGSQWLVIDYGELLIHIMHEEKRARYNLEELWSDAIRI